MRRNIFRNTLISASIAAVALSGGLAAAGQPSHVPPGHHPAAEQGTSRSHDAEITRARESLVDLLVSERIDRIDFQAETYDQGMGNIDTVIDTIFDLNLADTRNVTVLADHAGQVIEALNTHKLRGMGMAFGKNVKSIPIRNIGEARMLGEVVGNTLSLIRGQFGEDKVSYRDKATKLFRRIFLDTEEGPLLNQYRDGIQTIANLPPERLAKYFQ